MKTKTSSRRFQLGYLILAAAILHVSVTFAVFITGRYQLFPSQVYASGIGKFASDGVTYEAQIVELSTVIKSSGLIAWLTWPTQLHVRLYSLPLALVSRWVSFNVLTIEPLNLIYYLGILIFIFKLGEGIFGYEGGLTAAIIVGVWPSVLLHTTQLLRDPLLILAVVVLVWCLLQLIAVNFTWSRLLLLSVASTVALVTIRIVRPPMWYVMCAAIAAGIIFFSIRSIQQRRLSGAAVVFALVLIGTAIIVPGLQPYFHNQQVLGKPRLIDSEAENKLPIEQQLYRRREAFKYQLDDEGNQSVAEDGSRIDADVVLNTPAAIIRHLPRALEIGFFAPFPNMWLSSGKQVGSSGRLISGFETLLTYVIESMALIGLWWRRKNLAAWLLAFIVVMGAVSLGLVANNMGAMYRLRYPFWVLLVVLGTGGGCFLFRRFKLAKSLD
jgi:hypothetical protein